MSIPFFILVIMLLVSAAMAIRARQLISSAIFLALVSALLSVAIYWFGAPVAAVVELSVGAGLVTVLFVYAVNISGERVEEGSTVVSKWLALPLVIFLAGMLAFYLLPILEKGIPAAEVDLSTVIWEQRALDILVQIVLIFSGVLGLLGLLAEAKAPLQYPVAEQVAARRQKELEELASPTMQEGP
jgi:uncharacterized MnhB-related membrane protein